MKRSDGLKWLTAGAFVGTVYAANWLLTTYGVIHLFGGLYAPAGVFAAGLGFLLRCALQEVAGRVWVLCAILVGAALSYWLGASALIPGGHVSIAVASACAFTFSELADYGVYTPLRARSIIGSLTAAQVVGATVDSLLFLWLAFGAAAIPSLFWGQVVGKMLMVLPAVVLIAAYRTPRSGAPAR
jgi:queuosine precursor transporter